MVQRRFLILFGIGWKACHLSRYRIFSRYQLPQWIQSTYWSSGRAIGGTEQHNSLAGSSGNFGWIGIIGYNIRFHGFNPCFINPLCNGMRGTIKVANVLLMHSPHIYLDFGWLWTIYYDNAICTVVYISMFYYKLRICGAAKSSIEAQFNLSGSLFMYCDIQ